MKTLRYAMIALSLLLITVGGCSQSDEDVTGPTPVTKATCEGCHTSEANLKATVLPDVEPVESGDG